MKKVLVLFSLLFLTICFLFHLGEISDFPTKTHAWAQSDRYALALGFLDNGFDFFHPQTYVLNHQFPGNFTVPSETSITSVDFPLHEYLIAGIMKLFNTRGPLIFRLYVLIYSLLGLVFLYKSVLLFTGSHARSTLVFLFAASSPVFIFYQSGFLPTIPSLSNVFIAIYFYIKYLKSENTRCYFWSVVFLTLAALSRTPFAIFIIALLCIDLLNSFNTRKASWYTYFSLIGSLLILIGYFIYNASLREKYGSMFLNHIMMPSSFQEFNDIFTIIRERWIYQFFTKTHYIYLFIALLGSLFIVLRKSRLITSLSKDIALFLGVSTLGVVLYSLLMFKQFANHNYYFLDTLYIPLVLFFTLFLYHIPKIKYISGKNISLIIVLALVIPLFVMAKNAKRGAETVNYRPRALTTIENFQNSKEYLDSLHIDPNSKILVLDAYSPNIPFILMDRYGYAVMTTTHENIRESLSWEYDYIIFQNVFFLSDIYSNYPEIINQTELFATNGNISVCKQLSRFREITLMEFLNLNDSQPVLVENITFDSIEKSNWSKINISNDFSFAGKHVGHLGYIDLYGITYKSSSSAFLKEQSRLLLINGRISSLFREIKQTYIVVSIKDGDRTLYYETFDLNQFYKNIGKWNEFNLMLQLPKVHVDECVFSVYVWNPGMNELFYDDIVLIIY